MLLKSQTPIQISTIQKDLKTFCGLTVSKTMLNRYLKEELNVSYRLLRPICIYHNFPAAKFQR